MLCLNILICTEKFLGEKSENTVWETFNLRCVIQITEKSSIFMNFSWSFVDLI